MQTKTFDKQLIVAYRQSLSLSVSVGFVPTMGALHKGHQSLIQIARNENDIVIVSIFVNPTQFGKHEDFSTYPRNVAQDEALCTAAGVDAIFAPSVQDMYPNTRQSSVGTSPHIDEPFAYYDPLFDLYCGKSRPDHFKGVVQIVEKLFDIVRPTKAYFGEKDYQQLTILKRWAQKTKRKEYLIGCPCVREATGLAMSSRNQYFNDAQRKIAAGFYAALMSGKKSFDNGEVQSQNILDTIARHMHKDFAVDYIALVDKTSMQSLAQAHAGARIIAAINYAGVRLLDNIAL